jgi:curved DNA-binding protein
MPVAFRDYYELLGVGRDASEEDVRRAYRTLARRYHPDVSSEDGAEERFKEISEAYEVLRDPEKRQRYDRLGASWKAGQDVSGTEGFRDVRVDFGGGDFSDFFESLFGAGVGARRGGGRAGGGGPPGDLLLRVRLRPHPRFRVEDRDLHVDLPVTAWEAALGASVPVPTLDGERQVTVPAGSSCGRRLRLRGAGMPGPRGGHGDLYAHVQIRMPRTLSDEERSLYERLAQTSSFDPRRGRG